MASVEELLSVQVLYQLSWDHGILEHPHMIEVQYQPNQAGLRLRDVKKRLTTLRGHGISESFSWSYKRNYRNTFIWNDLCDDDVIHPLRGSGEYLLKASELIKKFASKPGAERKQSSRAMPVETKENSLHSGAGRLSNSDKEDDSPKLATLSVGQETIDVEKSDFCLSSSDNEISPRPKLAEVCANLKPVIQDQATPAVMTRSATVQGVQTPRATSLTTSPMDQLPFSPGRAKRMWKREIRKSLFRTASRKDTSTVSPVSAAAAVSMPVELPAPVGTHLKEHEDASFWRHGRSKSCVTSANLQDAKHDAEPDQYSTSQLIKSLWARWTGGSSKGKRSTPPQTKQHFQQQRPSSHIEPSNLTTRQGAVESNNSVSLQQHSHSTAPASATEITNHTSSMTTHLDTAVIAESSQFPQELKKEKVALSVKIPDLQVDVPDSPSSDTQGRPPEAEIDTPSPAIARVKTSHNGLPRIKTAASPRPLPPGFHKGTNDTKPVQTPRRSCGAPLPSPPSLMRSLSRDAVRSLSARGANLTSVTSLDLKLDSITTPESGAPVKRCINFRERDERPLQPGLSSVDWEKALQEAVTNHLPPPNFREILQECSTCGRTFKPDSLQVHKRGCHPPLFSRAFSARASPHMIRTRAI